MSESQAFVLPEDVLLIPVGDLAAEVRDRIECEDDAYALTRLNARMPSKILDRPAVELLEHFRLPSTIVQAVLTYSRACGADPEQVLMQAHPMLTSMVSARVLVPEGAQDAEVIAASLSPGDMFGEFEIVRCLHVLQETEIYRARYSDDAEVALKLARPGCGHLLRPALERERRALEHLGGTIAPRFVCHGTTDDRPYIAMEWVPGISVLDAAQRLHADGDPASRARTLGLCCKVLDAYQVLHERGVIHSDVHPGNVLVDAEGGVRIIDYGFSRIESTSQRGGPVPRAGMSYFFDPEYANALLARREPPPSSALGEQYSLAAMCYLMLTGSHYISFSLQRDPMLRQICDSEMQAFAEAGAHPWGEVESVLRRALAKLPAQRYPTVAELAGALRAHADSAEAAAAPAVVRSSPVAGEAFLDRYLEQVRPGGALFAQGYPRPPFSSVNFGAAGLAYALYRMSCVRESVELLALADHWIHRAMADMEAAGAFYDADNHLGPADLGDNALFHTASGVHLVHALIANAQGADAEARAAVEGFGHAARVETQNLDVCLGRGGTLLGCAILAECLDVDGLHTFGDEVARELWQRVDVADPIEQARLQLNLGVAHGWAGVLYAMLRWSRISGTALPGGFGERLEQLAASGQRTGVGMRWRWTDFRTAGARGPGGHMPGWCNGSAGFVFLWTLCAAHFGEKFWLELAEAAAQDAWEGRAGAVSLCCGTAGSAYALLNLHRAAGEPRWMERALALLEESVSRSSSLNDYPHSLYKGQLGIALLACEMEHPEEARMPFFEHEGWPPRHTQTGDGAAVGQAVHRR